MQASLLDPAPQAWVQIDLRRFRTNLEILWRDKPRDLNVLAVIKDDAYGHGAVPIGKIWEQQGAAFLGVATLREGLELRRGGIQMPILLLGARTQEEYAACLEANLTSCLCQLGDVATLGQWLRSEGRTMPVHLKFDTGMSRYGIRWTEAPKLIEALRDFPEIVVDGVLTHFAMSDELDKTFANLQFSRFRDVLSLLEAAGIRPRRIHACNSGGFLDLPHAHGDMVRIGILAFGVYPSKVCRRIDGLAPVMSIKTRVALLKELHEGDKVGYGMRFTAPGPMRLAVLPIGYGAGFPRVRNQGEVLLRGRRAPIIGGVSMDALTVDVTKIPEVQPWDEVTIMGEEAGQEISVHELAALKNSVSYDILTGWQMRLPRHYVS